jgi:hypothetical protein
LPGIFAIIGVLFKKEEVILFINKDWYILKQLRTSSQRMDKSLCPLRRFSHRLWTHNLHLFLLSLINHCNQNKAEIYEKSKNLAV